MVPEIKTYILNRVEGELRPSDDVIVNVVGYGLSISRYYHSAEAWSVNGMTGDFVVVEWWPLPKVGTGNKV